MQGRKLGSTAAGTGRRDEAISVGASLVVAAVAGCTNVMLTLPIWVVITQMQALQKAGGEAARNAQMVNVARQMYADGGVLAFWKVRHCCQALCRSVVSALTGCGTAAKPCIKVCTVASLGAKTVLVQRCRMPVSAFQGWSQLGHRCLPHWTVNAPAAA